jgi:hypothetical protein
VFEISNGYLYYLEDQYTVKSVRLDPTTQWNGEHDSWSNPYHVAKMTVEEYEKQLQAKDDVIRIII